MNNVYNSYLTILLWQINNKQQNNCMLEYGKPCFDQGHSIAISQSWSSQVTTSGLIKITVNATGVTRGSLIKLSFSVWPWYVGQHTSHVEVYVVNYKDWFSSAHTFTLTLMVCWKGQK